MHPLNNNNKVSKPRTSPKDTKKRNPLLFELKYSKAEPEPLREILKASAHFSGRGMRNYFFKGLVRVNHRQAHSDTIIKKGDLIQVYGFSENIQSLQPETLPIDIVYEDQHLLVINKPALLPVHPSGRITSGTLANRVAAYFQDNDLKIKVRPVNRLDQGTSGLIIFAKSAVIQEQISLAIRNHQIARIYYAVVQGQPVADAGIINQPIALIRGIRCIAPSGQPAETHYRVVQRFSQAALLELSLQTGRTHQIRIHLQHLGTPIIGDAQYGSKSPFIDRPALHAGKLQFTLAGWTLPELTAPLPKDMAQLLTHLS
ncbi:MAG TPA: RluA family pseudouridine synthase [Bacillota bacterium]|nr:RluA family pseudouridine synthase [Bacillota bacterium]